MQTSPKEIILALVKSSIFVFFIFLLSCRKYVDIPAPSTYLASDKVFQNDISAIAALTGIYNRMSGANLTSIGPLPTLSMAASLSSDELSLYQGADSHLAAYYENSLLSSATGGEFWTNCYQAIYAANAAVEGLTNANTLSTRVKQQLLGEAKFIRAFNYFYIINLYGNAPLVLTTDYASNALLHRAPVDSIYQQILLDLKEAQALVADGYVKSDVITLYPIANAERVRPCRAAVTSLLARTYLYVKDYANAEIEANKVISNSEYYSILPLNSVFLKNSRETIWALHPNNSSFSNASEAYTFVLDFPPIGINTFHPVHLDTQLVNSAELGDERFQVGNWINKFDELGDTLFYSYKYKNVTADPLIPSTEYSVVMRLSEVYLIRAESRAFLGKIDEGISDVNEIRRRAGLPNLIAIDQQYLIDAVIKERRHEFFTEWGHRWFDLKRLNLVDEVMSIGTALKGGSWKSFQKLYPINLIDIQRGVNIVQNPGY